MSSLRSRNRRSETERCRKTTRTCTNGSSVPANRRFEFFAPGDPGHLAVLLGDEGDDAVGLTVRASTQHEGSSGDLLGHRRVTALVPSRPDPSNHAGTWRSSFVLLTDAAVRTDTVEDDAGTATPLLRVAADDPEYRRQASAEAAFWQQVHPLGLEAFEDQFAEGPVDHYVNTRFTGDPHTN